MHPKPKRDVNKRNLKLIKSLPCLICGGGPSDPDHFRTRGAGGSDDLSNLSPLCRNHHIEKGRLGVKSFWDRYSSTIILSREKYDLPPLNIDFIVN